MTVRRGVVFDGLHQLCAISLTAVIVINSKRIDVGRSSPEIALHAADNLSGFIAQITRDRTRSFVAGLDAVETAYAIEHDPKVFGLRMLIKFEFHVSG